MLTNDEYLATIKRLQECSYPDNAPHELDRCEAEQRMRDLWTVFNHDHPTSCQHDKCYASFVLMCQPPKCPWVCRKCGEEGTDSILNFRCYDPGEYEQIMAKKRAATQP